MSVSRVAVRAGYRLHLGFYRYLDDGLAYGSVGVALEEPSFELRLSTPGAGRGLDVRAPTKEAREAVARVAESLGLAGATLEVNGYVRHHAGLGSITRIYLATAIAASVQLRAVNVNLEELLIKLGRCKYSCVGYYTLVYGGLAVDTGVKLPRSGVPKPLMLLKFPQHWYVVLAVPEGRGLGESEEEKYMENPVQVSEQRELYRALVELTTGVRLERIDLFVRGVETIQAVAGKYFSQAQGGFFSSPHGDLIAGVMRESGLRGIGQSSWGPAVYGFTDSYNTAETARRAALRALERMGVRCDAWVTRVSDLGYTVQTASSRL